MQLKVSAEALKTDLLCGNEVATVPKTGQIDTVVRTLLVEVGNSASKPRCPPPAADANAWFAS